MKNLGVNLISIRLIVIPFSARHSYEAAIQSSSKTKFGINSKILWKYLWKGYIFSWILAEF